MKVNKDAVAACVCAIIGSACLAVHGELSPAEREFVSAYFSSEQRAFCGTSPALSSDSYMTQYAITELRLREILAEVVGECLSVAMPRPNSTNDYCSMALLKLRRYGNGDSLPVIQRAFLDPSGAFEDEALRAYFACVTNVCDVAAFAESVWTNSCSTADSSRAGFIIAATRWVGSKTDITSGEKNMLYSIFSSRSQVEPLVSVAMRLDALLLTLNSGYATSSVRTNLVNRFRTDTTSRRDPFYFKRIGDSMGLVSE